MLEAKLGKDELDAEEEIRYKYDDLLNLFKRLQKKNKEQWNQLKRSKS